MNEKLTVRNFGPIDNAEVEFKRVTVFIGPTGGGKSTLAKLAAIFRDTEFLDPNPTEPLVEFIEGALDHFQLTSHEAAETEIEWLSFWNQVAYKNEEADRLLSKDALDLWTSNILVLSKKYAVEPKAEETYASTSFIDRLIDKFSERDEKHFFSMLGSFLPAPVYIPAERAFAGSVVKAPFGLQRSKIALPDHLIEFLSAFEVAREEIPIYEVPFLNVTYTFRDGKHLIQLQNRKVIELSEAASGIQSVLPLLMVVDNHASGGAASSFIVEEPELNLYPNGQRALMNHIMGATLKSRSDLTLTTHSPYILSHLNLLLYAHQVATQYPDRADDIAKLVPRESWIDPKEFTAYYVGEGGVRSIVSEETQLISTNELDEIAGSQADVFDQLIDISRGFPVE